MKIMVTGAGGYIGMHLVEQLVKLGHHVISVDIGKKLNEKTEIKNINIFSGDKDIYQQSGEPDVLIHLAWKDGFAHNSSAHMENLSSHYTFIENMFIGGLKQIVTMGSMHEVGYYVGKVDENTPTNPMSQYGVAKNALRKSVELLAKKHDVVYQWIRGYYIVGDDLRNNSIFSKISQFEKEGKSSFPFVSGENKYDFINVDELAYQIALVSIQTEVDGIINCCSGIPISLRQKVEEYIKKNNYKIRPEYGAFPERPYDSSEIYGDNTKIQKVIKSHEDNK